MSTPPVERSVLQLTLSENEVRCLLLPTMLGYAMLRMMDTKHEPRIRELIQASRMVYNRTETEAQVRKLFAMAPESVQEAVDWLFLLDRETQP